MLARRQATLWAGPKSRMEVARKMYAWRMKEIVATRDIEALRGMEGARVKQSYIDTAARHGVAWHGRHYNRANPSADDMPNQAINHASAAMRSAAAIAVMATATIPELGFVHESQASAWTLDIADLYHEDVMLDIAFGAAKEAESGLVSIDKLVRTRMNEALQREGVIPAMIERIQTLLG
jgi:CRISPR-associated protein Cas1